jgi:uncharacterized protein
MTSPTEDEARLVIGAVEEVSPGRIVVSLELDAPHGTAIINGHPVSFPRVGGYVVVRTEIGRVVGVVTWIGIERAAYPKRPGLKDFGLIDLPFPLRKVVVTPLGTLGSSNKLERGVAAFPSVGDPARLPTPEETLSLVQADPPDDRVEIGRSVAARGASVTVNPDRLFGRHLAILGNTGSGKSCTVAGLVRWSLDAAECESRRTPPARFIILDPNGEYREAFDGLSTPTRVLQVPPPESPATALKVPAWYWNSHEWVSFVQAAPGAQRPVLLQALRDLRAGRSTEIDLPAKLGRNLHGYRAMLRSAIQSGPEVFGEWRGAQDCKRALEGIVAASASYGSSLDGGDSSAALDAATAAAQSLFDSKDRNAVFTQSELEVVVDALDDALAALPAAASVGGSDEDAPIPFVVDDLIEQIEFLAEAHPSFKDTARYLGSLTMRIASLLGDGRIRDVVGANADEPLDIWLEGFLGSDGGAISVVDLSLVPSEIVQLVTGVIARVLFEALQRHHRRSGAALPTVIVLEEAHNFVSRRRFAEEGAGTPQDHCVATFERIAREGRKFGCSLVISSQRPAELSETVLAQCNTFMLHRLVNERDQQLVRRLVPDALGGILDELPALPARHAVLLGWATTLPVLVEVRELEREFRPRSADPAFWESWTAKASPGVAWGPLVAEWTGLDSPGEPAIAEETPPL